MLLKDDVQQVRFLEVSGEVNGSLETRPDTLECKMKIDSKILELAGEFQGTVFVDVTMGLMAEDAGRQMYSSHVKARVRIGDQVSRENVQHADVVELVWPVLAGKLMSVARELDMPLSSIPLFMPSNDRLD
ncbi:hypothetical protein [Actinotignum timonense]